MKHVDLSSILNKEEYKFPMLVWSEVGDKTTIHLANNKDTIRLVDSFTDHNLNSLILKLQELGSLADFMKSVANGDPATYPVDIVTLKGDLNWKKLIENYSAVINSFERDPQFEDLLNDALCEYYKADIAAATIDAIYNSIIYYMITEAQELGLNNLMFVGDITYQERFAILLNQHLPEEMVAQFSDF